MLHTRLGSQGYVAPEMIGLLPRKYMRDSYSKAVDMWAFGCVVYELLTGQIPFREIEYEPDGTTEFEPGTEEFMEPRTDMDAVKSFCDGKTEFPTDILRKSQVSEAGIEFVKGILVANPDSRATAKVALGSAWLLCEEANRSKIPRGNRWFRTRTQNDNAATSQGDRVGNSLLPGERPVPPPKVETTLRVGDGQQK